MRRRGLFPLAILCAGCGDNILPDGEAIDTSGDVAIVAGQDDLAILAPDLPDRFARRSGVTVVHLASGAGNADELAAVAAASGTDADEWLCGYITIEARPVLHCRLPSARVSLLYLGFASDDLATLWGDPTGSVATGGDRSATYDRDGLVATLAGILQITHPHTLRTLDPLGRGPGDEDETARAIAGALTYIVAASVASTANVLAFRPDTRARSAVGTRMRARGRITTDHAMCMSADDSGTVGLVPCAGAPIWTFAPDGNLHLTPSRCLQTLLTDELVVGACGTGTQLTFRIDDEGHIFPATLPIVSSTGLTGDVTCLFEAGGRVRAKSCSQEAAPTWFVDPPAIASTPRAALGITGTGRALRIADIAGTGHLGDVCEIAAAGGLRCAAGAGDGTFAAAARIDGATHPLAIEPTSLALGDVDGDGATDACGHVASGLLCALAADGFDAAPWSDAFGGAASVPATGPSLTVANGDARPGLELCARSATGIACVSEQGPAAPPPITTATASETVWIADLDGDDRADWCTTGPAGLSCGLGGTDAMGAAYDFGGISMVGTVDTEAFGDLDGDGFADHCRFDGTQVVCARGQGYGFGPEFAITGLAGAPIVGDLDGDGRADICAATATSIDCAVGTAGDPP